MKLSEIMIPPVMSSTMKMEDLKNGGNSNQTQTNKTQQKTEEQEAGRPEKPDSEKSEKTIQNKESMS